MKVPYVCGPLTDLPWYRRGSARKFYQDIAGLCERVIYKRAFVPHKHFDPITQPKFTPQQVDAAERKQIKEKTSVLIVVALAPSWGGGIEVEMANRYGLPIIILQKKRKRTSRLLRGNPAVTEIICYRNKKDALSQLAIQLKLFVARDMIAYG